MANLLTQTVLQESFSTVPKRVVVMYKDDITQQEGTSIVNYDDLTTEEKATFDAFQALCESKMI